MASGVTLNVKDTGQLKLLEGFRMSITGGVHEEDGTAVHDQGPLTVYEVAAVNEFGGGKIPARMWLRGWVTRNSARFVEMIKSDMLGMVRTQKFQVAPFERTTEALVASLRAPIVSGQIKPANAPATLARKAPETRPLFEHGQLVAAIKSKLRANNGWRADKG